MIIPDILNKKKIKKNSLLFVEDKKKSFQFLIAFFWLNGKNSFSSELLFCKSHLGIFYVVPEIRKKVYASRVCKDNNYNIEEEFHFLQSTFLNAVVNFSFGAVNLKTQGNSSFVATRLVKQSHLFQFNTCSDYFQIIKGYVLFST